MICLCGCMRN